ncbi:hypothetical protein BGX26_009007 [Mortierella sp. AD094]|nr:hypothetical protein BGX26_009007 [Mortierella sp. AD094]
MSSAYGTIARPVSGQSLSTALPRHATLRSNVTNADGEAVHATPNSTLFRIASNKEVLDSSSQTYTLSGATHATLVDAMHQVFNEEVERGDTYPQEFALDASQFENYFFSGDSFVLIKGHYQLATEVDQRKDAKDWQKDLLGFFYIKPNFPVSKTIADTTTMKDGRCSHICNGGFIVNSNQRGLGIGSILGKAFLKIVPIIGYKASMFNLVFVSNVASVKLWRRLGFLEIGRVPKAGRLRGQGTPSQSEQKDETEGYVDAIQFYWDFETMPVPVEYDA